MQRIKNWAVVLGLIGGLMSMGTVIGGFVSVVRFWDQLSYVIKVVDRDDVRYYHETLKPRVEILWEERDQ